MEKRINLCLLLCLSILFLQTLPAAAQQQLPIDTQDKFVVSDLQTNSNGTYFTVSLQSADDRIYCAYNMTITLPVGLTFITKSNGKMSISRNNSTSFYPYDEEDESYPHSVQGAIQTNTGDRVAKVICSSNDNSDFLSSGGDLFNVYVNISQWAKPGANEVKLTGLNLTTKLNAQKYVPEGDLNTGDLTISAEGREISVNISTDNKWATCILPFDYIPEDTTVH